MKLITRLNSRQQQQGASLGWANQLFFSRFSTEPPLSPGSTNLNTSTAIKLSPTPCLPHAGLRCSEPPHPSWILLHGHAFGTHDKEIGGATTPSQCCCAASLSAILQQLFSLSQEKVQRKPSLSESLNDFRPGALMPRGFL